MTLKCSTAQLVAALTDGCSSLHQEGVCFFPPSIEKKFVDKTTFGDTDMFNAQLVAALPDGCCENPTWYSAERSVTLHSFDFTQYRLWTSLFRRGTIVNGQIVVCSFDLTEYHL